MSSNMKMDEYIESELSGIFHLKLVVKNMVLGYSRTHFMRMSVKKETPIQVFSCEFCELFKNNLSYRTPSGKYFYI